MRAHVCMFVDVCMFVCVCVCERERVCVYIYMSVCVYPCVCSPASWALTCFVYSFQCRGAGWLVLTFQAQRPRFYTLARGTWRGLAHNRSIPVISVGLC